MFRSYLNFFRYDIDAWKYDRAGDVWMWHRMTRAGVRSSFVPKVGVLRPLRPDQIAKAQATAEFVRRVSVAQL